jgi:UrcA family protein
MRAIITACAFAAAAVTPAFANDGAIRIKTDGRDFSSPAAIAGLHAQIERAARQVCGLDGARLSARAYAMRAACVAEKMDEAVRTANLPALSALHASLKAPSQG